MKPFQCLFALLFITLFFVSCTIEGLTNDYRKLNENQKAKIIALNNFAELNPELIYKINGSQLREEIKKYPRVIVYIVTSSCTSEYCRPISVYENYAKQNGYKLFLVMDGYAELDKTTDQEIKSPLFVIDNKFYKCNLRPKYYRYFTNDFLNKPLKCKDKLNSGRIYFFNDGNLDQIRLELP